MNDSPFKMENADSLNSEYCDFLTDAFSKYSVTAVFTSVWRFLIVGKLKMFNIS